MGWRGGTLDCGRGERGGGIVLEKKMLSAALRAHKVLYHPLPATDAFELSRQI